MLSYILYELGAAEGTLSYPYAHMFRGMVHVDSDPAYARAGRTPAVNADRAVPVIAITANILESSAFGSGFYISNPPWSECPRLVQGIFLSSQRAYCLVLLHQPGREHRSGAVPGSSTDEILSVVAILTNSTVHRRQIPSNNVGKIYIPNCYIINNTLSKEV